ncbi:hypothetical protein SteCoe_7999 [Stentor coeruleus]|uniref:C2H2-type domain-containing protein n=1 Tax=Stentor coeruleus TaxID=5963 RepID=A0A1R2CL39_9CILI|nr:hypothetical protein SteCoe_7999 [Stentor coeruleus]
MDLNLKSALGFDKNKRRSKNDKVNRSFTCGCGKSYLSYPALYTHIKTKHDGYNPQETISNNSFSSKKRGRPKKIIKEDIDINKILAEIMILGGTSDPKSELVDSPLFASILRWQEYKGFKENDVKCDDSFAMYLNDTAKIVEPHNFNKIVKFVENLRNCLEKHLEPNAKRDTKSLPEKLNYFIQHYIPLYIPSFDRKLATSLAVHFSQWLLTKGLTDIKLSLI